MTAAEERLGGAFGKRLKEKQRKQNGESLSDSEQAKKTHWSLRQPSSIAKKDVHSKQLPLTLLS
jgi:hypothetical protein